MNNSKPQLYFLLFALIGTFVLAFFIFRPFLYALVLAVVFAIVLQPIYQKIVGLTNGRQEISALMTVIFVIVFIFTPLIFLGVQIFQEAQQAYASLAGNGGIKTILNVFNGLLGNFQNNFSVAQDFSFTIDQYLNDGLTWLVEHLGSIFKGFAKIAISSFIFLIALYYLLKDGAKFKTAIMAVSPLDEADDEIIFQKLGMAINTVVEGNLLIALVQGILTCLGLAIFGIANPVLWGSVAAVAALVPGIGTALVLTPAILFLFLTGGMFNGAGLLIWGVLAVGLVDNFLGPKLIGHGIQIHPLLILLSVIGGLAFFGPLGFLLGPLTITLLFVILDIYSSFIKRENL